MYECVCELSVVLFANLLAAFSTLLNFVVFFIYMLLLDEHFSVKYSYIACNEVIKTVQDLLDCFIYFCAFCARLIYIFFIEFSIYFLQQLSVRNLIEPAMGIREFEGKISST
jgi:hypothetical protein